MEKYGFTNNRQEINKKEVGEIHKNHHILGECLFIETKN